MTYSNFRSVVDAVACTRHFWEFELSEKIDFQRLAQEINKMFISNVFLFIKLDISTAVQRYKKTESLIYEVLGTECTVYEEDVQWCQGKQERFICAQLESTINAELLQLLIKYPYSSFCILSDTPPKPETVNKLFSVLAEKSWKAVWSVPQFIENGTSVIRFLCGNDGTSCCILEKHLEV